MTVMRITLVATMFFSWLVAGKSLEQVLLVGEVAFVGLFLGWIGTQIVKFLEAKRYMQLHRK